MAKERAQAKKKRIKYADEKCRTCRISQGLSPFITYHNE